MEERSNRIQTLIAWILPLNPFKRNHQYNISSDEKKTLEDDHDSLNHNRSKTTKNRIHFHVDLFLIELSYILNNNPILRSFAIECAINQLKLSKNPFLAHFNKPSFEQTSIHPTTTPKLLSEECLQGSSLASIFSLFTILFENLDPSDGVLVDAIDQFLRFGPVLLQKIFIHFPLHIQLSVLYSIVWKHQTHSLNPKQDAKALEEAGCNSNWITTLLIDFQQHFQQNFNVQWIATPSKSNQLRRNLKILKENLILDASNRHKEQEKTKIDQQKLYQFSRRHFVTKSVLKLIISITIDIQKKFEWVLIDYITFNSLTIPKQLIENGLQFYLEKVLQALKIESSNFTNPSLQSIRTQSDIVTDITTSVSLFTPLGSLEAKSLKENLEARDKLSFNQQSEWKCFLDPIIMDNNGIHIFNTIRLFESLRIDSLKPLELVYLLSSLHCSFPQQSCFFSTCLISFLDTCILDSFGAILECFLQISGYLSSTIPSKTENNSNFAEFENQLFQSVQPPTLFSLSLFYGDFVHHYMHLNKSKFEKTDFISILNGLNHFHAIFVSDNICLNPCCSQESIADIYHPSLSSLASCILVDILSFSKNHSSVISWKEICFGCLSANLNFCGVFYSFSNWFWNEFLIDLILSADYYLEMKDVLESFSVMTNWQPPKNPTNLPSNLYLPDEEMPKKTYPNVEHTFFGCLLNHLPSNVVLNTISNSIFRIFQQKRSSNCIVPLAYYDDACMKMIVHCLEIIDCNNYHYVLNDKNHVSKQNLIMPSCEILFDFLSSHDIIDLVFILQYHKNIRKKSKSKFFIKGTFADWLKDALQNIRSGSQFCLALESIIPILPRQYVEMIDEAIKAYIPAEKTPISDNPIDFNSATTYLTTSIGSHGNTLSSAQLMRTIKFVPFNRPSAVPENSKHNFQTLRAFLKNYSRSLGTRCLVSRWKGIHKSTGAQKNQDEESSTQIDEEQKIVQSVGFRSLLHLIHVKIHSVDTVNNFDGKLSEKNPSNYKMVDLINEIAKSSSNSTSATLNAIALVLSKFKPIEIYLYYEENGMLGSFGKESPFSEILGVGTTSNTTTDFSSLNESTDGDSEFAKDADLEELKSHNSFLGFRRMLALIVNEFVIFYREFSETILEKMSKVPANINHLLSSIASSKIEKHNLKPKEQAKEENAIERKYHIANLPSVGYQANILYQDIICYLNDQPETHLPNLGQLWKLLMSSLNQSKTPHSSVCIFEAFRKLSKDWHIYGTIESVINRFFLEQASVLETVETKESRNLLECQFFGVVKVITSSHFKGIIDYNLLFDARFVEKFYFWNSRAKYQKSNVPSTTSDSAQNKRFKEGVLQESIFSILESDIGQYIYCKAPRVRERLLWLLSRKQLPNTPYFIIQPWKDLIIRMEQNYQLDAMKKLINPLQMSASDSGTTFAEINTSSDQYILNDHILDLSVFDYIIKGCGMWDLQFVETELKKMLKNERKLENDLYLRNLIARHQIPNPTILYRQHAMFFVDFGLIEAQKDENPGIDLIQENSAFTKQIYSNLINKIAFNGVDNHDIDLDAIFNHFEPDTIFKKSPNMFLFFSKLSFPIWVQWELESIPSYQVVHNDNVDYQRYIIDHVMRVSDRFELHRCSQLLICFSKYYFQHFIKNIYAKDPPQEEIAISPVWKLAFSILFEKATKQNPFFVSQMLATFSTSITTKDIAAHIYLYPIYYDTKETNVNVNSQLFWDNFLPCFSKALKLFVPTKKLFPSFAQVYGSSASPIRLTAQQVQAFFETILILLRNQLIINSEELMAVIWFELFLFITDMMHTTIAIVGNAPEVISIISSKMLQQSFLDQMIPILAENNTLMQSLKWNWMHGGIARLVSNLDFVLFSYFENLLTNNVRFVGKLLIKALDVDENLIERDLIVPATERLNEKAPKKTSQKSNSSLKSNSTSIPNQTENNNKGRKPKNEKRSQIAKRNFVDRINPYSMWIEDHSDMFQISSENEPRKRKKFSMDYESTKNTTTGDAQNDRTASQKTNNSSNKVTAPLDSSTNQSDSSIHNSSIFNENQPSEADKDLMDLV